MKDQSISLLGSPSASEFEPSDEGAPTQGKIGFIGLGQMGTAMAANLANTARRVTAYVRRPDQMGTLIGLGLRPTMEFANLFDCEVVISMLPDDGAVRDVVLGREDAGVKGLASGLKRGAIHLSMSTISTSAAAFLAAEHARRGQRVRRGAGLWESGCRQGAPVVHCRRRGAIRCRALPAALRQPRPKDICRGRRAFASKPRQAARQYDDRDHIGDAGRSGSRGS